jgi:TRAP-type C4-dicarboxylate transport system substrate-binding protein
MNKDRWASLPDDVKKTIQEINKEWIVKHGKAWDDSDAEGMEFLKEKKRTIIKLNDAESKKWADAVKPVLEGYVKAMKEKGLPGKEALDTALGAMK